MPRGDGRHLVGVGEGRQGDDDEVEPGLAQHSLAVDKGCRRTGP